MSLPEVLLWQELRRGGLDGLRLRRQHPMGPYILDFYCAEHRLAVEVDGEGHGYGHQPQHDARRDAWLASQDLRVLRIDARTVLKDMDVVLATILAETPPPSSAAISSRLTLPPEEEDP